MKEIKGVIRAWVLGTHPFLLSTEIAKRTT